MARSAALWLFAGTAFGGVLVGSATVEAATIGSSLSVAANESVCEFQSLEPETRICSVGQRDLLSGHTAADGLATPFSDQPATPFSGVIVRWSVVTGTPLPGTGVVKLALRSRPPSHYLERGPEVELPLSLPGTRHTFPERMPVTEGNHLGLRISIENRNTGEAGAPIAFRQDGIGTIDTWVGDPFDSIWEGSEEGVELLMAAEVEPDGDRDGYGDLTQDCSPNQPGSRQHCDLTAPAIQLRAGARQPFLKTGSVVVHALLNETGFANAAGKLVAKGSRERWISALHDAGSRVVGADTWTRLRLRVRKRALRAARIGLRKGKKVLAKVNVSVTDAKGNERQETVEVRSR